MARNWIAVACAEHALRGRDAQPVGFMQVCHGKVAPLRRVSPGDRVVYYAPAQTMQGADRLQSFVSLGVVQAGEPYAFDMGGGFVPFRRDVAYVAARPAPIAPLLAALDFVENRERWGYPFRRGLFEISAVDMQRIARAMQVPWGLCDEGPEAPSSHSSGSMQRSIFETR
ncbi:EVE domain-containing protein [Variovorax sp. HJSM1_2]|uniref:EVE domain-containing protein n=1 Tax=Variovorax sp. HJSM1_2 TaxID=3366263 RepID=UPI003BCD4B68